MVRVEQLVIHDLHENLFLARSANKIIELVEAEDARLLDKYVSARIDRGSSDLKVTVVGSGDADDVEVVREEPVESAVAKVIGRATC
jgi:hypothetical protein